VAEAERVAEEARKQEEEQRRRAAEVVAQQGAAGGSGDGPMDMDRMAEEEKTKKKKNKGKGKQTVEDEEEEEMELVGGAGRCRACVRDNEQCHVNTRAILRWRASVEAGRVTTRAPTGTSCQRCNTSLHRPCDLPGTADLRKKVNERKAEIAAKKAKAEAEKELAEVEVEKVASGLKRKAAEETGAASGSKRRKVTVEVDPRKKKSTKELTEGEFCLRMVELMGMLVGEAEEINQGITLSNILRQRSLALWEGLAAEGRLPLEPWVVDGEVKGYFGLEKEWAEEEMLSEEEEEEPEAEAGDDEGEEEEEEDDRDIVIEEQEQEEPEE